MAVRPVFTATPDNRYCVRENTEFQYFSGFSDSQKKKCIKSLHEAYVLQHPGCSVLEISSRSEKELGVQLSAFHLTITTRSGKAFSVESAFQSSKVFENGGPYTDLLDAPSITAKRDERLRSSGRVIAFAFQGQRFSTEPKTYFYHWLYINALQLHPKLAEQLLLYDAFTDIAFNPKKSINCQAEAAAIYVSLQRQGLLEKALASREDFLRVVYPHFNAAEHGPESTEPAKP